MALIVAQRDIFVSAAQIGSSTMPNCAAVVGVTRGTPFRVCCITVAGVSKGSNDVSLLHSTLNIEFRAWTLLNFAS